MPVWIHHLTARHTIPSGKARRAWLIHSIHAPFRDVYGKAFSFVEEIMPKRLGVVGIVIEDLAAAEEVNSVLHAFAQVIVGRMGIPYRERGVSIISIIVDGTGDDISALTGRLGRIRQVSVKTALAKDL